MFPFNDPFREFELLRREVDRAFQSVGIDRGLLRNAFLPGRAARAYPLVNVSESPDAVVVEALAPGLNPDTLEITVKGDTITLAGEKPAVGADVKPEHYHRSERASARFVRTLQLPADVTDTGITAEYRSGVLVVTLPKAESAKPRKIAVSVA